MAISLLCDFESSLRTFISQITSALGFGGLFAIALAVEIFFVFLFVLKTAFSYEARLHRSLDKLNNWLFKYKRIDQSNIKEFNELINKCPKRVVHNWQQYILFREKDPAEYLSADNLIEKPLKTSGWMNNIKNLNLATIIWTAVIFLFTIAYQAEVSANLTSISFAMSLVTPVLIIIIGVLASIALKGKRILNLDDIYAKYHIFARFINNACVDIPQYIDYDLLFTQKEIEKGNPQLREFYESRARQAKEEFENAKKSDIEYVEYNFEDAGVDGSLVLERAMRETEAFINKKTSTLAKIAHVEAQKEALKRNYENVQKDLQRKIQASKENINKLIAQQEATTNRMEVGFLRKQQEQEIAKQESLQQEYDQEETRFAISSQELEQEVAQYHKTLDESKESVQEAMVAEYQTFYEKVMKSAYSKAEKKVAEEKNELKKERDQNEKELIVVQTQIKRLMDENNTLRARLESSASSQGQDEQSGEKEEKENPQGQYDEKGNYVYADGSYHDANGLFHDVDGNIYDMNGTLIREPSDEEQEKEKEIQEEIMNDELAFGKAVIIPEEKEEKKKEEPKQEEVNAEIKEEAVSEKKPAKRGRPRKTPVEDSTPKEPKKRGRPRKVASESAGTVKEKSDAKPEKKTAKKTTATSKPKVSSKASGLTRTSASKETKRNPYKKKAKPTSSSTTKKSTKSATKPASKKTASAKPAIKKSVSQAKSGAKTVASKTRAKAGSSKSASIEAKNSGATLEKINEMIAEEESRLNKMKFILNSEIGKNINQESYQNEVNAETNRIMQAVEDLKTQAETVKGNEKSDEELAKINKRLEDLISEISKLNSNK